VGKRVYENLFFSENDLTNNNPKDINPSPVLVSSASIDKLKKLFETLRTQRRIKFKANSLDQNHEILILLDVFRTIGVLDISKESDYITVDVPTEFGLNFVLSFIVSLFQGFKILDNWYSTKPIDDRLTGLQLLLSFEKRRVEQSKLYGVKPEVFRERPVAFGIIKSKEKWTDKEYILFEENKDWHKYNLIGGKQENNDQGSFEDTLFREIEEEIGINRKYVKLTRLNNQPISSYGLTGNFGALAGYPAYLFHVHFSVNFEISGRLKWIPMEEFKQNKTKDGKGFMISPFYLDFLFNHLEGGIESLTNSFKEPIIPNSKTGALLGFLVQKKEITVAIIVIVAALITAIKKLFF